jgi:hypothetical protein
MSLDPGQIRVNDLVMGRGTPYIVRGFNPWKRPHRQGQGGPVPWGNGRWKGAQFRDAVPVPMTVIIMAPNPSDWVPLHDALAAAFDAIGTSSIEHELEWNLHGYERIMFGTAEGVDTDPQRAGVGISVEPCMFTASDGAMYSTVEHSVEMGLLYRTGGYSVPFRVPAVSHAVVAGGEVAVSNAGTAPAKLLLRITGPVPAPRVSVVTDTTFQTLSLDTVLGADDWLDIDTQKRTVLLNGSVTRLWDHSGDWPLLPPGPATVRFESDEYNPIARLAARWRDTY